MIYTVTFNPSIDYTARLETLKWGSVNRTCRESIRPGGKGLNVSIVLKRLGIESVAIGFIGGFTGDAIADMAEQTGIRTDFIRCEGYSRINVKLKTLRETEINGKGVCVGKAESELLMRKLAEIKDGDWLVLAGSVPCGASPDTYADIMRAVSEKDVKVVADASGDLLKRTLRFKPFLVKPNVRELGEVFGVEVTSEEQVLHYARELQLLGARNVVVSLSEKGAVMLTECGRTLRCLPPQGEAVDSVCAGDSLVAGVIAGLLKTGSFEEALITGVAAGSATAFSEWLADGAQIEFLKKGLKVQKI